MGPAATPSVATPPDDPVRKALDDPEAQKSLVDHAIAVLGRSPFGCLVADRQERAKDACQETCLRALQRRSDYDPARPVRPWLHGIMNHVLSETARSVRRSPIQEPAELAAWEQLAVDLKPNPADITANQAEVASYLSKLIPEHRELLMLRYYEALDHSQIAARLGISVGNARVRLCRALIAAKMIAGVIPQEDRA
jgi:RNA polymerase sigma-70 factor (ECF subfamily)